jgi:hypothetical protein
MPTATPGANGTVAVAFTPTVAGTYTTAVLLVTRAEVQHVSFTYSALPASLVAREGSVFTLLYGGARTVELEWDASADAVAAALQGLDTLGPASVAVVRAPKASKPFRFSIAVPGRVLYLQAASERLASGLDVIRIAHGHGARRHEHV